MLRVLGPALVALVLVPPAFGGGTSLGFATGGAGATAPGSDVRYVTLRAGTGTVLSAIGRDGGIVRRSRQLDGRWGVPLITLNSAAGGISHDGKLLVLGDARPRTQAISRESSFQLVDTKGLQARPAITFLGDFGFDALSPDGRTLYLIEHPWRDINRYQVRAYDTQKRQLLPRIIADKTQQDWTMTGWPVARTTSPDGRWVYTLYRQQDNYPFVHALDTVARRAVCTAVPEPWQGNVAQQRMTGALRLDGSRLEIADRTGAAARYVLDTKTFRVSKPAAASGPPLALGAAGMGVVVLAGALLLVMRRRSA